MTQNRKREEVGATHQDLMLALQKLTEEKIPASLRQGAERQMTRLRFGVLND